MSLTNFPTSVDTIYDPSTSDTLATANHHTLHGTANDAISAIETKLGFGTLLQSPTTNSFLVSNGTGNSQWQPSPTSPSFTTSILDTNRNTWIGQTATASAVNYLNITNAATGNNPSLSALGSDSNIGVNIIPKGSGKVQDNGSNLIDFRTSFQNFISPNTCLWTIGSGLTASMTGGTIWISGVQYTVASIGTHTFGANVDTYIDYTIGTGITYTAVSNNAASPSLAANSVRVGIAVSGATLTIINQGNLTLTGTQAPTVSSNTLFINDSLGNRIYPSSPISNLRQYQERTTNASTGHSSSQVSYNGFAGSYLFYAYSGRLYDIAINEPNVQQASGTPPYNFALSAYISGTQIGQAVIAVPSNGVQTSLYGTIPWLCTTSGTQTLTWKFNDAGTATGTWTLSASTTAPATFEVIEKA